MYIFCSFLNFTTGYCMLNTFSYIPGYVICFFIRNIAHFSNHCTNWRKKNSGTRCFLNEKYNNSLWKESLNSNGEQFHQYQQNKQSSFTWTHWTQKRPQHMMLEIQVLAWDSHTHVAGLNQLMGSQIFPFDNWVSMLTILFNF